MATLGGTLTATATCYDPLGFPSCAWEGTASWTMPASVQVFALNGAVCFWRGCSAWSAVTASYEFCPPEGWEGPDPTCEWEWQGRLCACLAGCSENAGYDLYLWVEFRVRLGAGDWIECNPVNCYAPGPYPWAWYRDGLTQCPEGGCPDPEEPFEPFASSNAPDQLTGNYAFCCGQVCDFEVEGQGTYQIGCPCFLWDGPYAWPAQVWVTAP